MPASLSRFNLSKIMTSRCVILSVSNSEQKGQGLPTSSRACLSKAGTFSDTKLKVSKDYNPVAIASLSFDLRTAGLWAQHANHCATMLDLIEYRGLFACIYICICLHKKRNGRKNNRNSIFSVPAEHAILMHHCGCCEDNSNMHCSLCYCTLCAPAADK